MSWGQSKRDEVPNRAGWHWEMQAFLFGYLVLEGSAFLPLLMYSIIFVKRQFLQKTPEVSGAVFYPRKPKQLVAVALGIPQHSRMCSMHTQQ